MLRASFYQNSGQQFMGQYYKPVSLDKKEYLYTHDFGNGLKLMEHSYIGNDFMNAVEKLLTPLGRWHKTRIVWAGDYADPEIKDSEFIPKDYDGEFDQNHPTIWDLTDELGYEQIAPYEIETFTQENNIDLKDYPYIVNHTAKVYIDKRKIEKFDESKDDDGKVTFEWKIHPLSLLTAEGNGRGGGDYHEGSELFGEVGLWARAVISIEKEVPEDYKEEEYPFKEN